MAELARNGQMDRKFAYENCLTPGVVCPCHGPLMQGKLIKLYQALISGERLQDHWSSCWI